VPNTEIAAAEAVCIYFVSQRSGAKCSRCCLHQVKDGILNLQAHALTCVSYQSREGSNKSLLGSANAGPRMQAELVLWVEFLQNATRELAVIGSY